MKTSISQLSSPLFLLKPYASTYIKRKSKKMNEPIVSSEWVDLNLNDPDLILLDASQASNTSGILPELDQLQIKGSRSFDLKGDFSLKTTNLPNMLPSPEQFEQACRNIGINKSSKLVVYDNLGIYFSPRVWWMFRTMGHQQIAVLNGGLPDWISKNFSTEPKKVNEYPPGDFCASFREDLVKDFEFIKGNIGKQDYLLIDARPANRFDGIAPEPRKGLRSGSIPNSINIPFDTVLEQGKFKSEQELIRIFDDLQIGNRPLIFSCGSGVTACIVLLACELILDNDKSVYDGSWTEWATRTQNTYL